MLYITRAVASLYRTLLLSIRRLWARVALVLTVVAVGVFASPTAAYAASAENGDLIVPFSLDWIALLRMLVIPVLLPALVGFINRVTPGNWPTFVKRLALAAAALAQSIGIEFLASYDHQVPYDLWGAIATGALAYVVAELTYRGFYKAPLNSESPEGIIGSVGFTVEPLPASTTKADAIKAYNDLAASPAVVEVTPPATTIASKIAG